MDTIERPEMAEMDLQDDAVDQEEQQE